MKWDTVPNTQDEINAHEFAICRSDFVVCADLNSLSLRYYVYTERVVPHDDVFNYATPSATRTTMRHVLNIIYHIKQPLYGVGGLNSHPRSPKAVGVQNPPLLAK